MLKGFFVEVNNVRAAPFVVSVAFFTFFFGFLLAVKAALFGNIFFDIFVAIRTQRALRSLIKRFVAVFADFFLFNMALNQLARH